MADCNALLAARDALAGSATLNWSSSTPIADWQGVTVDNSPQRVTELDLHDEGPERRNTHRTGHRFPN